MERSESRFFRHFDFWLLGATLLLCVIGLVMIYSATECVTAAPLDLASPTIRQAIFLVAGLAVMLVLTLIDYRLYGHYRWALWAITLGMLAIVSVIGVITHGAQRWVVIGFFLFQPSELSKLFLVLVTAKFMADHQEKMGQWRFLIGSFFFVAIPMGLVYLQPDLGTTIVMALTWGIMALAGGMRPRDVLIVVVAFILAAPLLWANLRPYQQERIMTFIDPTRDPLGAGYNVDQARTAIGSGGLYGLGVCSGTQTQLRFLRIRQTDFIFSVIGEELGFVGAAFVIVLVAFILLRLVRAAQLARTTYGKLIAVGVTGIIFVQSFVNLGMNLGLMPVTGIPLPFVSSGGSSLISLLAAEGVVQSILVRHQRLELEGSGTKYS